MYDKHDYSILTSLSAIFDSPEVGKVLTGLRQSAPFTLVDIGCGFSLRYTGHVLYGLARNGITDVMVHVVDPALYGHGTHLAIGEVAKVFPKAKFSLHSEKWDPQVLSLSPGELQLATAIQTTSLFDEPAFRDLHAHLGDLLADNGLFVDISESDDQVTDRDAYPYLDVFSRTMEQRVNIAGEYGFCELTRTSLPAHAASEPDNQMMDGLALSRWFSR